MLALGAAAAPSLVSQSTPAASTTKVITADQIAASRARTAWDALRLLVTNVQFREPRGQQPRMTRRGRASIYLEDQVNVLIDGVRVYDLKMLQEMPASDILTIEVLTGLDATTYFGGGSTGGAIVIRTKSGESP